MGNAGKSVKLCADSLYIDDIREYPIEIETESDGKRYMVNPTIFDWQSVGADCCDVVEGVVRGVTNGRTVLQGNMEIWKFNYRLLLKLEWERRYMNVFLMELLFL